MKTLKQILETPDKQSPDDDHPFRKDISPEEFDAAMSALARKYKRPFKDNLTKEEREKRGDEILKAMNTSSADRVI